jgi:hypothetical protein
MKVKMTLIAISAKYYETGEYRETDSSLFETTTTPTVMPSKDDCVRLAEKEDATTL